MLDFIARNETPIILEVEPPITPVQKKRIEFYRGLGFYFNPYEYYQPPLSEDKNVVHLFLMSYPEPLDPTTFSLYKKILYNEVYKVKDHKKRANIF